MRKSSDGDMSAKSGVGGFSFGVDPVLGMANRRLRGGGSWVSAYGPATVLPSAKTSTPADRVGAIFAADADARKQKEVRRAQARQRDIDALSRRIQELPGLYNQDRDRLTAYVNRNVPTGGSLQDYAVGLKRISQEVLGAAGQGPAGIARLTQEQNEADRQAAQVPWMQGTNPRGNASRPRSGSLEDRMLALDATFGNDPNYRRQRDIIKYRVQDNARREASRALAYKRDPDADVKTALHAIDRRDLNSQFQRAQAAQRLQDQVNRETAANAGSIRAGNPNYAASAEQSDDFTHQTGAMTPGEIGQAGVNRKVADAPNEWLQAYKSLNLDLYKLPAGAARAIPGLLWQMFIGSTLSPEQRKKQFEVFNSTGIFDNLANRIPLMGTLDGLSQVSNLLGEYGDKQRYAIWQGDFAKGKARQYRV